MNAKEIEFLKESNAIEGVYDADSLMQAVYAWEYLKEQREMTIGVVLKTHKVLMLHQKLMPNEKGYFRDTTVYIGGKPALNAVKIRDAMDNWCKKTTKRRESAKKLHIEYEHIHPFIDGNGRTGRMFMNWSRRMMSQDIITIHEGEEQMEYYKWFK
jgi:Fic family protein